MSIFLIWKAILYPGSSFDSILLKNIIDYAYWPIFGEISILDDLNEIDCNQTGIFDHVCSAQVHFSYILVMFYMILANVLLVNLLIAMFR